MLRAARNGEDRPPREQHHALPLGLAQGDVQVAVEYQEEFVGVVVDVSDVFALDLGDADVAVVHARDDAGAPQGIEGGQSRAEGNGARNCTCRTNPRRQLSRREHTGSS